MKQHAFFVIKVLSLAIGWFVVLSCSQTQEKVARQSDHISFDPDFVSARAEGGLLNVRLQADSSWRLASSSPGVSAIPGSGGPGNATLTVSCAPNTDSVNRTGYIVFQAGLAEFDTLTVLQKAALVGSRRQTVLTTRPWVLTAYTRNGIDLYKDMPPCLKAVIFQYDTPNSYLETQGADKCWPNDTLQTGTWVFRDSYSTLVVDNDPAQVVAFSDSAFTLRKSGGDTTSLFTYGMPK